MLSLFVGDGMALVLSQFSVWIFIEYLTKLYTIVYVCMCIYIQISTIFFGLLRIQNFIWISEDDNDTNDDDDDADDDNDNADNINDDD